MKVTEEMVGRFLSWKLPYNFCPDGGISFAERHPDGVGRYEPVGTNLFTAPQARAMLEHVLGPEQVEPYAWVGPFGQLLPSYVYGPWSAKYPGEAAMAKPLYLGTPTQAPINMVLHCPRCGLQHIDAPDKDWANPPHRSHLCLGCKYVWRPADVPTNGVQTLKTSGREDFLPMGSPPFGQVIGSIKLLQHSLKGKFPHEQALNEVVGSLRDANCSILRLSALLEDARQALADIAVSKDMHLTLARQKAERVYRETDPEKGNAP